MFNFFSRIFGKTQPLICGGKQEICVIHGGKHIGSVFYIRPEYEQILAYQYKYTECLDSELHLKNIEKSKQKLKEMQDIIVKELFLPEAKKIFCGSKGFFDGNGKSIDNKSIDEQYDFVSKYFGYVLIDMVAIAFKVDTVCKKKH